jgi:hypothetical protein
MLPSFVYANRLSGLYLFGFRLEQQAFYCFSHNNRGKHVQHVHPPWILSCLPALYLSKGHEKPKRVGKSCKHGV